MNISRRPIQTTLATAAAAVVLSAAQLTGIDSLAKPRLVEAVASPAYLPLVVVTASRAPVELAATEVASLPRVVVSARAERVTAQARAADSAS